MNLPIRRHLSPRLTRTKWQRLGELKRKKGNEKVRLCTELQSDYLNSCATEAAKKKGHASTGMAHFYRQLLEDSEKQHEATVAATSTQPKPVIGPQASAPNLTITKPPEITKKTDLEIARAAREDGKDIELNDDNQIVDKRELLSAGLNLSAPNTRRLGLQKLSKGTGAEVTREVHRAVGMAASRKEINERRAREIRQQMDEEQARATRAKELADHEAIQRIVTKRNNPEDVMSARERYLQRKRRKLEEATESGQGEATTVNLS